MQELLDGVLEAWQENTLMYRVNLNAPDWPQRVHGQCANLYEADFLLASTITTRDAQGHDQFLFLIFQRKPQ